MSQAPTITANTDALTGVIFAITGGRFRVQLSEGSDTEPGRRSGWVLDGAGQVIGCAHDRTYGARGWTIETAAYGGFHPADLVDLV